MAVFRMHRKTWEKGARALPLPTATKSAADASSPSNPRKRPHDGHEDADTDPGSELTGGIGQSDDISGTSKKGKVDEGYGPDVLRLWAATVEFWKDMTIGPTVLQQCAETMRKVRNSARFILGSLGDRPFEDKVDFADLALVDRYVLHRLHRLENIARDAYVSYDYPKGEQTSI